jgi:Domain of unknown function (DUF5925)
MAMNKGPVIRRETRVRERSSDLILVGVCPTDPRARPSTGTVVMNLPVIVLPGARRPPTSQVGAGQAGLAVHAAVDDADSPRDVLDLLVLETFVTGRQPYARTAALESVRPEAPLAPPDARVVRETIDDSAQVRLYTGDGWTLGVSEGVTDVPVASTTRHHQVPDGFLRFTVSATVGSRPERWAGLAPEGQPRFHEIGVNACSNPGGNCPDPPPSHHSSALR